ncbi:MAG TPA: HAMP domain-containing sensor histidine kinase [Tepidisphaeraceae bacterium]|jgi:signal transduction histidine kinase
MDYCRFFESRAWKYAAAVLLVASGVGLNLLLTRKVEPSAAPLLFAAVLIAAWQGGWGPGLLATALASLSDDYFFIPPLHILTLNVAVMVRLAVFLSVALLTSYLTSRMQQARIAERDARLEAEEANRNKDRFLAVTSHELRSPLSAMLLWSDLMAKQGVSDESAREGVEVIQRNIEVLRVLIDDLFDVARIAAGKISLVARPLDVAKPLISAIEAVHLAAEKKRIKLEVSIDAERGLVNADSLRIQQVATNLLTNAVKFTPESGTINVQLRSDRRHIRLCISDTGCGIAVHDLPRVFDRFWQANENGQEGSRGLGLGLSIAKHLVELHGGSIAVESDGEGCGTTFTVELPVQEDRAANVTSLENSTVKQPVSCSSRPKMA